MTFFQKRNRKQFFMLYNVVSVVFLKKNAKKFAKTVKKTSIFRFTGFFFGCTQRLTQSGLSPSHSARSRRRSPGPALYY